MATVLEKLELIITATESGARNAIAGVGTESEQAATKTGLLQSGLKKVGLEGATTGQLLQTGLVAGALAGGAAIAKFAVDGVQQFASLTGEVRAFSRVSGESAESSSKLVFAVKQLGIEPDAATSAFGRLATRLGTGKADLEQYGIKTRDANGHMRDMADIVADLSDKYQKAGSAQEKAAVANEAFGKSWQTLAPLLGKGADELQRIYDTAGKDHQIFSQADLEAGRQFSVATRELSSAVQGIKVELGKEVMPMLTDGMKAFTTTLQTTDQGLQSVGLSLGSVTKTALNTINPLGSLGDMWHGVFGGGGDDANKFADAQKNVENATLKLANAVHDHGRNSQEAASAQRELQSASRELQTTQTGLQSELQKTNTNLQDQATKAYLAAQAALSHGSNLLNVQSTVAGVSSAMDNYNLTLYGNATAGDTSKAAQERLDAAHRNLVGSTLAAVQAAGQKAADDLGPNATAAEKAKAVTDAQKQALADLEAKFPGLREQLRGYVGELDKVPSAKSTQIWVDTAAAYDAIHNLNSALDGIPRTVTVGVSVVGATIKNAFGP